MNSKLVGSMDAVARSRLRVVRWDAPLAEAAALLSSTQISLLVVCDRSGTMVGIITKTDIVQQLSCGEEWVRTRVAADLMVRDVVSCQRTDRVPELLVRMAQRGVVHVPVLDDDRKPVGVVNARDALRSLVADEQYEELLLRDYVMGVGYQ